MMQETYRILDPNRLAALYQRANTGINTLVALNLIGQVYGLSTGHTLDSHRSVDLQAEQRLKKMIESQDAIVLRRLNGPVHWCGLSSESRRHTRTVSFELKLVIQQAKAMDLRNRLIERAVGIQEQAKALLDLVAAGDPDVSSLIAEELGQEWLKAEWKSVLVIAAEQAEFTDDSLRKTIKTRLRHVATEFYHTQDPKWEPVVWSAVRRYASMLTRGEVELLRSFLDWTGAIDARQVTLQAIQSIFESAPSEEDADLNALRDRVFTLAENTLRPESFASGKTAALAMNAVAALAALGDNRLSRCVQATLASGRAWFQHQVKELLQETCRGWSVDHVVTQRVLQAITALNS